MSSFEKEGGTRIIKIDAGNGTRDREECTWVCGGGRGDDRETYLIFRVPSRIPPLLADPLPQEEKYAVCIERNIVFPKLTHSEGFTCLKKKV
ncbi:hypothetical protein AVEN_215148-1 [Araneus ventricosus]|uniref:Uncharacterized protein n=1 Tax=Araneus ventricosus TaxID=182803 RepID=A0A4Y2P9Q0_ARAVE